jgi:uncharacterized protein YyaL (SSP411 family)
MLPAAEAAAGYLLDVHWDGRTLRRVSSDGQAQGIEGLLEDYAGAAEGLFALYAATGNTRWHNAAQDLVAAAVERFLGPEGLSDTAQEPEQIRQAQGGYTAANPLDDAVPSGTALLAGVLLSSSSYGGPGRHRELAEGLTAHVRRAGPAIPQAVGWSMAVQRFILDGPKELAVTGTDPDAVGRLLAAGRGAGGPGLVIAHGKADGVGLLQGRETQAPALAYVCRGMVCRRPVDSVPELEAELAAGR